MKMFVWIGITIGSLIGGLIGAKFDGGLGVASIGLSAIGGFVGLWAGYKAGQYFGN